MALEVRNVVPEYLVKIPKDRIVHLKGFGSGRLGGPRLDEVLLPVLEAALAGESVVVWDGDNYDEGMFTRLIPSLLRKLPELKAIAFKYKEELDIFTASWQMLIEQEFPGRVSLVLIDAPPPTPSGEMDYRVLGYKALEMTGSLRVFAHGGGKTTLEEAQRSVFAKDNAVRWTVFRVRREGLGDDFGLLWNWAAEAQPPNMELLEPAEEHADGTPAAWRPLAPLMAL